MDEIISNMISKYKLDKMQYDNMYAYYIGEHDIKKKYIIDKTKSNEMPIVNYIRMFIDQELGYSLGNPISYSSKSGNEEAVKCILNNTFHWRDSHNQDLMRQLEIYGKCFLLWYVDYRDGQARFNEKILNPQNAIAYQDDSGKIIYLIHFYKKPFDDSEYYDVYYPDGQLEIFKDGASIEKKKLIFNEVPAYVCAFDNEKDTIYDKIKSIQDAFNLIFADATNLIADYRCANFEISGQELSKEEREVVEQQLKDGSILNFDEDTKVQWVIKNVQDTFIENNLERHRNSMLEVCNHVDATEKLQSNTSGVALRNRLIFLEQRCDAILSVITDAIYERIYRLYQFIALMSNIKYDWTDIDITVVPNIPADDLSYINACNQLGIGQNISLETTLSGVSFVENAKLEKQKIEREREEAKAFNLDMIEDDDISGEDDDVGGEAE